LLTESSHTVKVNIPPVPTSTAHLYPRLAGSNWTCYLNQPTVILGRSNTTKSTDEKKNHVVHVDFGGSKAISRKHCEIRFSEKRDRWELYVYGRNGVKLNHVMKKPRDKPVVLTTGVLIEISNTRFVFILPNNYLKPNCEAPLTQSQKTNTDTDSEVNTPINEDLNMDKNMERAIAGLLVKHTSLYTFEIYEELKNSYDKTIEKVRCIVY
jgi:pSer/pThr/pTyr-binding forkhead associated (FHA) protein